MISNDPLLLAGKEFLLLPHCKDPAFQCKEFQLNILKCLSVRKQMKRLKGQPNKSFIFFSRTAITRAATFQSPDLSRGGHEERLRHAHCCSGHKTGFLESLDSACSMFPIWWPSALQLEAVEKAQCNSFPEQVQREAASPAQPLEQCQTPFPGASSCTSSAKRRSMSSQRLQHKVKIQLHSLFKSCPVCGEASSPQSPAGNAVALHQPGIAGLKHQREDLRPSAAEGSILAALHQKTQDGDPCLCPQSEGVCGCGILG